MTSRHPFNNQFTADDEAICDAWEEIEVRALKQPVMPSAAQLELLASVHNAQAMVDSVCGINAAQSQAAQRQQNAATVAWSKPNDPTSFGVAEDLHATIRTLRIENAVLRSYEAGLRDRALKLEAEIAMLRAHPPVMKAGNENVVYRWNADAGRWISPFENTLDACGKLTKEGLLQMRHALSHIEPKPAITARADAKPDDSPKADYHGPDDAAHRSIHEAAEHLMNGRVTNANARRGLRDALDKADKPSVGRTASDHAIGRALRFGGSPQIGLRLP
jgi:hypothetical protein